MGPKEEKKQTGNMPRILKNKITSIESTKPRKNRDLPSTPIAKDDTCPKRRKQGLMDLGHGRVQPRSA